MKLVYKLDASPNFPCLNGSKSFYIHHNILLTEIGKNKKTLKRCSKKYTYIYNDTVSNINKNAYEPEYRYCITDGFH